MDPKLFTKTQLEELILELSGLTKMTPMISRQISRFVIDNKMSYLEIARCVDYYVEILGHEIKPEYGIAFVISIREPAAEYFKKLEDGDEETTALWKYFKDQSLVEFRRVYDMLGVYLPLITVNCIILGRAEMFAGKNAVGKSALDGIGMGIGFTLALVAMATIREVLGNASFAGIAIPALEPYKIALLVKAPGGMLVYGLLIALVYAITSGKAPLKKSFSCAGCPGAAVCGHKECGKEEA